MLAVMVLIVNTTIRKSKQACWYTPSLNVCMNCHKSIAQVSDTGTADYSYISRR
jgi:hypothetical protein